MRVQAASDKCPAMQINNTRQRGTRTEWVVAASRDKSVTHRDREIAYCATLVNIAGQGNQSLAGLSVVHNRHFPRWYGSVRGQGIHQLLGLRMEHTHTRRRFPGAQDLMVPSVGVTA